MTLKTKAVLTALTLLAFSRGDITAEPLAPASDATAKIQTSSTAAKAASSANGPTSSAAAEAPAPAAVPTLTRVTGIGGVFIKAKEPAKLRAWYKVHLGIDVQVWGGTAFRWTNAAGVPTNGSTAWRVSNGANFAPSTSSFMINYRVAELRGLVAALRTEGCTVLDQVEESEFGIFGWVMDPEGNKVELWQPPEGK